ncbi:molybdenum ABC transporter ATP-binding protein [Flavimaricola marinus]|nr:molybdenum ABC transporter ATP-binding protein [Flavimaricola marinus]
MLEIALRHRFAEFSLDVAFEAPQGVTALFGRSGAGKTTVVDAVAGLMRPDEGRVVVDGRVLQDAAARIWLPPHKRRVGYVFQEGRLFPHLTVRGNLEYGLRFNAGAGPSVDEVADLLGIASLLERRPSRLSGGEKQRVAIGRALMARPAMLLMDEPLAALDGPRKAEILPYLARLRDETKVPILYVSHALDEVAQLATTLVLIEEGGVRACGPVAEVLSDPALVPQLGVRGAGAVLSATVVAHDPDGLTELACAGGRLFVPALAEPVGQRLRLRIEAQDVMIALDRPEGISALNILSGVVTALRQGDGPGAVVQIAVGEELLLARITRRSARALNLAAGVPVHTVIKTVSVAPGDIGAVHGGA